MGELRILPAVVKADRIANQPYSFQWSSRFRG